MGRGWTIWLCLLVLTHLVSSAAIGERSDELEPCHTYVHDSLIHVDCSSRELTELPIGLDYNVQVLILSNNMFTSFPHELENFKQIVILDMSGNRLSRPLPSYLQDFSSLQTLNLSNNNYDSWVNNGYNYGVRYLDLSKNKISKVDEDSLATMPNLFSVDLSENRIGDLPPRLLANLNFLDTLILSRNYFSEIPSFQSPSLRRLHLSYCQIAYLNTDSLAGINSLLEIDLSMNQIEFIPNDFASNTLQELNLSYNGISTLTDRTFSALPHLAVLDLRGNDFRDVWSPSLFSSNPFLREVLVKGNRWSCDDFSVNLLLMFEFLTKEPPKVADEASLICYTPSNVTQMSWQQAYIRTWHPHTVGDSYPMMAIMIGIIIGILITSCVCRGLMTINKPDRPPPQVESAGVNLNGTAPQPRAEAVVTRIPLTDDLPPSYDEALLMPRLNSSFHSLPDFVDDEVDEVIRDHRRSRSIGDLTATRPRIDIRRSMRRTVEIRISSI